jgi:hypothetical protein
MRASFSPILIPLLAGAAATVALAIGACANPDTQSPTACTSGPYGLCEGFAVCASGPASTCCVDADGGALTGNDLYTCLYGYGDPSCTYLVPTTTILDGGDVGVSYMCSTTMPTGSGGSDGG